VNLAVHLGSLRKQTAFRSSKQIQKKTRHLQACFLCTPKVTIVERSQLEIEQFLAMLRFENRKMLEELPGFQK
jgi:hypothetical protein